MPDIKVNHQYSDSIATIQSESEILEKISERIKMYTSAKENLANIDSNHDATTYDVLIAELTNLFKWIKGEEYY